VQLSLYGLFVSGTVLIVTVTVHFTWQDNKDEDRSLRASDLLKVLVQFLQLLVIIGSISVPWPSFLAGMFTAAASVFAVASGESLSPDCWLPHYLPSIKLPLALQRQLLNFVGAVFVAVACLVLMNLLHGLHRVWHACWHRPRRGRSQPPAPELHFWSRLRVTVLVTAYFAYPTLVKAALSFFACLQIDIASKQPHPEYAIRNHTSGYWVSAMQQECFAGWHRPWALGFGLPLAVVLCLVVPFALWLFLWRSKPKVADPLFREHYGFLFCNYRDCKLWWEAVWAVQTVLLTAVSVFHFTFQAYYALLVMELILLTSVAVQVYALPYASPLLHRLHLASTCCLFLIVWLSMAMFSAAVEGNRATLSRAHFPFGVGIILIGGGYVVGCLVIIGQVARTSPLVTKLRGYASGVAAWLQQHTGVMAAGQP
jgi:hypothetical protein